MNSMGNRAKRISKPKLTIAVSFILLWSNISLSYAQSIELSPIVEISWVNEVPGDFGFISDWSYPEGVYINRHGQLSCDGLCPYETDGMKDDSGKIYSDSLKSFYNLVDTTHLFHTLHCEAWTYEWGGSNYARFKRNNDSSVSGYTETTVGSHSSLVLMIRNDSVSAFIAYNSVSNDVGNQYFPLASGKISINKKLYKAGIIQASFDFKFDNTLNHSQKMFWKGMIYAKIQD